MGNIPGVMKDVTQTVKDITETVITISTAANSGGGNSNDVIHQAPPLVRDPKLAQRLTQYQQQHTAMLAKFNETWKSVRDQRLETKIESFEDLKRYDEKAGTILVDLAHKTEPIEMHGRNYGFFGLTSTGKSTIINKLLAKNVAEVGAGETTASFQSYEGRNYTLYDIPGRNDETTYFTMEYIAFWKGLTCRIVVVTTSVKEMTKVLRLLDELGLSYDIVVNKLDTVPHTERETFKAKIKGEIVELGLKSGKRIWFFSAKNPDQFPDWIDMVNTLTN